MIQIEVFDDRNIVAVAPEGPLAEADFEQLARTIDPLVATHGTLAGLMIRLESFPGWHDFGAFRAHLKFVADHQRRIARIAVVTDSILKILPRIAGFVLHPDIRTFAFAEKDRALAWLQAGGGSAGAG